MSRLETVDDRVVYPYLQRPIPYLITYLIIIGVLGHYGIAPFGVLKNAMDKAHVLGIGVPDDIQFSLGVLTSTALFPLLIALYFLFLVAIHPLFSWFVIWFQGKNYTGVHFNWRFFPAVLRRGFWRGYRYRELVPALLFYNANAIVLASLTFYVLRIGWKVLRHAHDFNSVQGMLLLGMIVIGTVRYFHGLIMRPLLYAVLFRSDRPALRHGYFLEVLIWGRLPKRPPAEVYPARDYLSEDLLPCAPEAASFVCQKLIDKKGRPAGGRITPLPKARPASQPKEIARQAGGGS